LRVSWLLVATTTGPHASLLMARSHASKSLRSPHREVAGGDQLAGASSLVCSVVALNIGVRETLSDV
jgi:hypothetical protein